jgi:hypothetical protein
MSDALAAAPACQQRAGVSAFLLSLFPVGLGGVYGNVQISAVSCE